MKKLIALILTLAMVMSLAACGGSNSGSETTNQTSESKAATETKAEAEKESTEDSDETSVEVFLKSMDSIVEVGDKVAEDGLRLQPASYYAFAGASVSALRYAVEYILWLKGEGDDLASFTAESRYVGWDQIAAVSYASPYPYYFEGLIYHVQDKKEEAKDAYVNAVINPAYPEDGVNFYYLKNKSVDELYKLRDELREKENEIYAKFNPELILIERDPCFFDTEYLRVRSREAVEAGDYKLAASYAIIAVQNDPMDVLNFKNATVCCLLANDLRKAGLYLDQGLLFAPDDEALNTLYNTLKELGGSKE
ncbi:MAG: hypothetical protein Q4B67_00200 [Eubacteriales bacterium]|nr:hypothetical protein [Eubacteriales bacterium]